MSFSDNSKFSTERMDRISRILGNLNTGIWEYNTVTKETHCSDGFYAMLGYKPGEIECSYEKLFENVLYYDDEVAFLKSTEINSSSATKAHIRLLTKSGEYQWFESTAQWFKADDGPVLSGLFTNINTYKTALLKAEKTEFLASETGRIAKIGGWEIDVATMKLRLSRDIYDIYELKDDVILSVDDTLSFIEPAYRPIITAAVNDAINYCKPYDLEVLFRTAKNKVIWVRAIAIPIIDGLGRCVIVRGILQDIDLIKKRGISMQSSINLLDDQNKRLQNFAYMVSHNLRSHAGNLKFMVSLYEDSKADLDKKEIFSHIKTISNSLNATMGHLDEIVKIQSEIGKERKLVNFEDIFNNVASALNANIKAAQAVIESDFTKATHISYIPAYLESIFQNLLTNALKYRHPERAPHIKCETLRIGDNIYLNFEDNGLGIDLQRHGEELFGLYKTFHFNNDAKGIGLFITRNQVEALGGNIQVESTINVGTKFSIRLV
jgi:signal transduction histidine kinase